MITIDFLPVAGGEMMAAPMQNGPNENFAVDLESILQSDPLAGLGGDPGGTKLPEEVSEEADMPPDEEDTTARDMGAAWQALLMMKAQMDTAPPDIPPEEDIAIGAIADTGEAIPEEGDGIQLEGFEILEEPIEIELSEGIPKDAQPQDRANENAQEPDMSQTASSEKEQPEIQVHGKQQPVAGILEGVEKNSTMEGEQDFGSILKDVEVTVTKEPERQAADMEMAQPPPMRETAPVQPDDQEISPQEAEIGIPAQVVNIEEDSLENAPIGQSKSIFTAQEGQEEAPTDAVFHAPEEAASDAEPDTESGTKQGMQKDTASETKAPETAKTAKADTGQTVEFNIFAQNIQPVQKEEGIEQQVLELISDRADIQAADQIVQAAEFALMDDKQEVKLRLAPESLGDVHITLTNTTGGLTAKIVAENPETQQLLASQIYQLEEQLKTRGVEVIDMEVSYMPDLTQQEQSQGDLQFARRHETAGLQRGRRGIDSYDFAVEQEIAQAAALAMRETSSVEFSA